jgi:poly(3-hydroxyalkanoate) synthetase
MGGGKFEGGHLVSGFGNLDPANTLWSKYHHLWVNIDTETPRFLEFEKWSGGHVDLSAEEMQWIVDELFIGNRMATAELVSGYDAKGRRYDEPAMG